MLAKLFLLAAVTPAFGALTVKSPAKKLGNVTLGSCINTENTGTHTFVVKSGDATRTFDMFVPDGLVDDEPRPVLFLWHGFAGTPAKIAEFTHANINGQMNRWIVIYPTGSGLIKGFNGAGCCPGVSNDDVQFSRDIVDWLKENMCVDTDKIFSSGFSNGGFMSNRLACEASDVFAAIAPHSGTIGLNFDCQPTRGMPVLIFHGDADPTVPYYGNGQWMSFADESATWAKLNQCEEADGRDSYQSETTSCVRYDSCGPDEVPVEFCSIAGLDHNWSGTSDFDIDATDYLFAFFDNLGKEPEFGKKGMKKLTH